METYNSDILRQNRKVTRTVITLFRIMTNINKKKRVWRSDVVVNRWLTFKPYDFLPVRLKHHHHREISTISIKINACYMYYIDLQRESHIVTV